MTNAVTAGEAKGAFVPLNNGNISQREHKVSTLDTIKSAEEQESCCFWNCLSSFFCCICNFFSWLCSSKTEEKNVEERAAGVVVKKPPTDPQILEFVEYYYPNYYTDPDYITEPIDHEKFLRDFLALPAEAVRQGQIAVWDAHFTEFQKTLKPGAPAVAAINAYIKANPFDPALMEHLRSL